MRGTTVIVALIVVGSFVTEARAQTMTMVTDDCDRVFLGATIGGAVNGDRNGAHGTYPDNKSGGALDASISAEMRFGDHWGARIDGGTVAWPFQSRDAWGVPLVRDDVRITRATLTAVKTLSHGCRTRTRGYGGIGIGAYRYRFADLGQDFIRGGVVAFVGFDIAMRQNMSLTSDFTFQAIRGPDVPPVFSYALFVLQANVGVKVRF